MRINAMTFKIKYKKAFEQKCFQLMIEAYQTSLTEKVIQLDWNENDISSEIHKCIKTNPLRLKWRVSTNVEAHIPKDIPKVKGFADKFPRIDFRLTSFLSDRKSTRLNSSHVRISYAVFCLKKKKKNKKKTTTTTTKTQTHSLNQITNNDPHNHQPQQQIY